MIEKNEFSVKMEIEDLNFFKNNLADLLTVSRFVIGLVILCLSFIGRSAYIVVVTLTLVGAATDMLDGRVARHYFRGYKEGRLGKYDAEIDTIFVLCVLGYISFSGVVIHWFVGWGWIGLVLLAIIITGRNLKVIIFSEVTTVIALLVITLLYDPLIFGLIIAPVMLSGIIINRQRVLYLLFDYWPKLFLK